MYHVHESRPVKCSKCGSIDRFFMRSNQAGVYKECADCGHNNAPIITTTHSGLGTVYVAADLPKYQEF